MEKAAASGVRLIPLGGLGEIGLNMLVIEDGNEALIIDAGLMFPQENILGIDYLIPDVQYLEQIRSKLVGILLTHGHEDHIGALPFLLAQFPAPLYGAAFTLALLRERLASRGGAKKSAVQFHEAHPTKTLKIGSFKVRFIPTSHSTLGTRALAIETSVGMIVHSGDFKIDETTPEESRFDAKTFAALGKQGVLLLLSDSTNVFHEGHSPVEASVEVNLRKVIEQAKGRVVIGVFSSHIQRIQQTLRAAVHCRRKVAFSGRSLEKNVELAQGMGLLELPPRTVIAETDLPHYRPQDIVVLSTGSQGELRAVLPRLAREDHPHLKIAAGDTIILSARIIPGNERPIYQMINAFTRMGATVHYGDFSDVQSSGHAYADEQRQLISLLKPTFFIPVHGEYRHLVRHGELAREMGLSEKNVLIAENGDVVQLTAQQIKKRSRVETGRWCVYGSHTEPSTSLALRERKALARGGVLSAVVAEKKGRTLPRLLSIQTHGLGIPLADAALLTEIQSYLDKQKAPLPHGMKTFEALTQLLRRFAKERTGRKPIILLTSCPTKEG